jgi:hypothetical protein
VSSQAYRKVAPIAGWALTMLAVAVAMVVFRAGSVASAIEILQGMVGFNGFALPAGISSPLGLSVAPMVEFSGSELIFALAWIGSLMAIAILLPNSMEILERVAPALSRDTPRSFAKIASVLAWRPSPMWALVVSVMGAAVAFKLGGTSEFLYWQF